MDRLSATGPVFLKKRAYDAGMVDPVERDSRGILHPRAGLRRFTLDRFPPCTAVARFVDRYWLASWNLPDGDTYEQQVLVHPVVNVVFTSGTATVSGVRSERFTQVLAGAGRALGVMFRPGGFRPFTDRPMAELTGAVLQLTDVLPALGPLVTTLGTALTDGTDGAEITRLVDRALTDLVPGETQPSERTTAWAEQAATDRTLRRVEDLAAAVGTSMRGLQRAFGDDIGVGPKWVLRRYRLYDAAEAAARSERVDWAALAADLGYADQAHLTREFTAAVGQPPARYSRT